MNITGTLTQKEDPMFTPIVAVPAPVTYDGRVGLPGFSTTCTRCGMEITYTLETMVVSDAQAHRAYHERTGR